MKKTMRKIVGLLLAAVMILGMSATVFAEESAEKTNFTITINENSKVSNSFEAYQVFAGDLAGNVLSNVEWGKNINTTKITELQTALGVTSAADAAEKLAAGTIVATTFADTVAKYLTGTPLTNVDSTITVPVADAGYYLIKNVDNSATDGKSYTDFVLKVVGDCEFTPKGDAPELDKAVKNADEIAADYRDANNLAVGDTMNFQLTSKVPDMTGYDKYYFIINDTMSKGITYMGNVKVTIGSTEIATDQYTVTPVVNETDGTTSLKIVFKNFIQYKEQKDAAIVVTYDAKLNAEALTVDANANKASLTYSNNPNNQGTGEGDDTDDDDVVGKTPDVYTVSYTTNLGLFKYDGADKKALEGVTFTLTGLKNNDKTTITQVFTLDENGTYYKLTDDTYTEVAPNGKNDKCYASTTDKYSMTTTTGTYTESIDKVSITVTTDENGYADFGSLAAGEYELVEISTKDGYNMLTAPVKITITCDSNGKEITTGAETCTWTVTGADNAIIADAVNGPTVVAKNIVNVANNKGSVLPATGGIGTTIFYVMGAILVLGAGVVLVTRRRMAR